MNDVSKECILCHMLNMVVLISSKSVQGDIEAYIRVISQKYTQCEIKIAMLQLRSNIYPMLGKYMYLYQEAENIYRISKDTDLTIYLDMALHYQNKPLEQWLVQFDLIVDECTLLLQDRYTVECHVACIICNMIHSRRPCMHIIKQVMYVTSKQALHQCIMQADMLKISNAHYPQTCISKTLCKGSGASAFYKFALQSKHYDVAAWLLREMGCMPSGSDVVHTLLTSESALLDVLFRERGITFEELTCTVYWSTLGHFKFLLNHSMVVIKYANRLLEYMLLSKFDHLNEKCMLLIKQDMVCVEQKHVDVAASTGKVKVLDALLRRMEQWNSSSTLEAAERYPIAFSKCPALLEIISALKCTNVSHLPC